MLGQFDGVQGIGLAILNGDTDRNIVKHHETSNILKDLDMSPVSNR